MGNRTDNPFWSSGSTNSDEPDGSDRDSQSLIDRLFPSRIERALLLVAYGVGALYLVIFKVITIILIVIVRAGRTGR